MTSRVHMHIGLAKSGTTYLQRVLRANRALLRDNGVLVPGPLSDHFKAALELTDAKLGGQQPDGTQGAWRRVVEATDGYAGRCLISHEMFALASPSAIRQALEDLATDVRVVVTARDFGRQVPAVFQERVKNRSEQRYRDFLEMVLGPDRAERAAPFWRMQGLVDVTNRWSDVVGADRLVIATVPRSGADPHTLWRRFAEATELPDVDYDMDQGAQNLSLGVVEVELMRRLNTHVSDLAWPEYVKRVKRAFAERTLAVGSTSQRLTLPPDYHDLVLELSDTTITHLAKLGCRVVGDLEELRPVFPDSPGPMPDDLAETDVLDLALSQLADQVSQPPPKAPEPAAATPETSAGDAPPAGAGTRGAVRSLKARLRGN